ncbi:MAG: DUF695 domain-containing protein [Muribaculaceae bacterium]|nr:DUF695 domain-containing protein [Muribaculaceae bacterium]
MKFPDKWWSYPAEGESGKTVIVTGRDNLMPFFEKGKFRYRIDINWDYEARTDGMPEEKDAELMGEVTDAMLETFDKDKCAILTGIYTGEGKRTWVFYTASLNIFGKVLNRALEPLPLIPIVIEASEDEGWEEYFEMREATYVPDEEDE